MKKKLISIVSPVYNEEGNIDKFYQELTSVMSGLNYIYEIILVNDASKDSSLLVMSRIAQEDGNVKIINFSRNFGHQLAITAGIDYARGDAVIVLDSDLQDPPKVIPELLSKWEQGAEVVNAKRRSRKDGFFKDVTAVIFYKVLNRLLTNKLPENVGDFRLMDRKAVNVIKTIKEKDRYLRGLTSWIGFKQAEVLYDREPRTWGKTKYPLSKMFGLALNAVFSFSQLPMKLAALFGGLFLGLGVLVVLYAVFSDIFGKTAPGWTSTVLIISLFSGLQMLVLAIISEYVGRIYFQVQNRPLYIVSDTVNIEKEKPRN
jgi:polyisoprenyl-phosphate glycosyltransferase